MKMWIEELSSRRVVEVEIDESESGRPDGERDMLFEAWWGDAGRLDSFAAEVRALIPAGHRSNLECGALKETDNLLPEEVIAVARPALRRGTKIAVCLQTPVLWHQQTYGLLHYPSESDRERMLSFCAWDLYPKRVPLPVLPGPRYVALDAAAAALATLEDVEELFLRVCAPPDIVFAVAVNLDHPNVAPIERCASYHVDGTNVARDLALSWIFLHETSFMDRLATLSLGELAEHVERAPAGARVGVGSRWRLLVEYAGLDIRGRPEPHSPRDPADRARKGPRVRVPGEAELTREEVLAALATPSMKLLEVLDACAVPDSEWRAAEPLARELLQTTKAGAPSEDVRVNTVEHRYWIEQHAPHRVRRLPNGAVMLVTHPYRTLWPLWADALALLGVREAT